LSSINTLREKILSGESSGINPDLLELFLEENANYNALVNSRAEMVAAVREIESQINAAASGCEGILKAIEVTKC
jgi:hypothetical protein